MFLVTVAYTGFSRYIWFGDVTEVKQVNVFAHKTWRSQGM